MNTVYKINKGVSKPIVFKGLKAQYIAYLAIGLVVLLLLFAVLYIIGLNIYFLFPLIALLTLLLFTVTFRLSHKFGEHGLMKHFAKRNLPKSIRFRTRRIFTTLKYSSR